jgi:ATP-binding cassette subfamily C (CFTR/MRP) protein 4
MVFFNLSFPLFFQKTVRQAFSSCTIITIAHRLHTVIDYDRIAVLDKGVIVECGHPAELLRNPLGMFSALVAQTGDASARELRIRAEAHLHSRP